MANTYAPDRPEPPLEIEHTGHESSSYRDDVRASEAPVPAPSVRDTSWRESTPTGTIAEQLARIEDKTARIEEKYARSESFMQRVGDKVDAATGRMGEVALQSDLKAVRAELTSVARRVGGLPGASALVVTALVTAVLTAGMVVAALKYGVPGLLPR
jgi:hypothetical protein